MTREDLTSVPPGTLVTELRILNKARTKCEFCGNKTFSYASYEIGPDANGDYYLSPDILCDECGEELYP